MAGFATYSGQIFNTFVGYSMGIWSGLRVEEDGFNVFGLGKPSPIPPKHYFLMGALSIMAFLIVFTYVFLFLNNFTLKKQMAIILMGIYVCYFISALTFGILTRG